jgi:hypothetical protein
MAGRTKKQTRRAKSRQQVIDQSRVPRRQPDTISDSEESEAIGKNRDKHARAETRRRHRSEASIPYPMNGGHSRATAIRFLTTQEHDRSLRVHAMVRWCFEAARERPSPKAATASLPSEPPRAKFDRASSIATPHATILPTIVGGITTRRWCEPSSPSCHQP